MKELEVKKCTTRIFDIEELACKILGIDYDEIDADTQIIEEKLNDEFYIDLDVFQEIISRLLPLIMVNESPLTNEVYKGFADIERSAWLVKTIVEVKPKK